MGIPHKRSELTVGEIKTYLAMAAGVDVDLILKWRLQILTIGDNGEGMLMTLSDESSDTPERC